MAKESMLTRDYADWAKREVLSRLPEDRVTNDWVPNWRRTLCAIRTANGIFELISFICARWEFLGALYLGTIGDTGVNEALAYSSRFLCPRNSDYGHIHNISGKASGRSEFFTMFRNKTLHGGTPAAVKLQGSTNVMGWWIGFDEQTHREHLHVFQGSMHVNGDRFLAEFLASLHDFVDYLSQNADLLDGRLSRARFQRAFWARFKPLYFKSDAWMQEGLQRGIPS